MIKIVGGLCVIISSTLIGMYYGGLQKRRIKQLLELKRAIAVLNGEISFGYTAFPEAAKNISRRVGYGVGQAFEYMCRSITQRTKDSISEIWDEAFMRIENNRLSTEDIQAISAYGRSLGHLNRDMQLANGELLVSYIDTTVDELTRHYEKNAKMYRSIGFMGGLMIVVLLI